MPQIAQQDYIRIVPKEGRTIKNDAAALGEIKAAILRGTIWDCIFTNLMTIDSIDDPNEGRVLGVYPKTFSAAIWDTGNNNAGIIEVPYTELQYAGLSAVQLAIDEYNGEVFSDMPDIRMGEMGELLEATEVVKICVDDHYLIATESGGRLATITLGEQIPDGTDFVNITWDDAQKLIGLPIQQ